MASSRNRGSGIAIALMVIVFAGMAGHRDWARAQSPPPPPRPPAHRDGFAPTTRPQALAPTTRPLSPLAPGERRLSIQFENGHDTESADHGRPVVLIAAALKVPDEVFRKTFTHVHPAGPGSGGPTDAEARANKAAPMAGLTPYGVTDDRLNTVSNYYRYMRQKNDDLWQHRAAVAFAVVNTDNKVVRFDIADAGAGYTTPPKVSVENLPGVTVTTKLKFGTDLTTNGSIESLVVAVPATGPTALPATNRN